MPCDYKANYAPNWFTEIRPRILKRAGNKCEKCGVRNGSYIFRGRLNGVEVYQLANGHINNADTGEFITNDIYSDVQSLHGDPNQKSIKVVLTIAHLNHNTQDNEDSNLMALCQKHHLSHDKLQHKQTRENKKGQLKLGIADFKNG